MDEKKMFKICCYLFVISLVACIIGFVFNINNMRSMGPLVAYGPFMTAGLPYGWIKTRNFKLPFTLILGPIEFAVMIVVRVVICQLVGGVLFAIAAVKHFSGGNKAQ